MHECSEKIDIHNAYNCHTVLRISVWNSQQLQMPSLLPLYHGSGSSCSSKALGADAAVPVLETVRFAISQGVLLDLTRNYQHDLHSVRYIGSCTPQGFAHVVPSLGGLLNPLPLLPPSDEALQQVFSRSVLLWLQQFPAATIGDAEFLAEVSGSVSVGRIFLKGIIKKNCLEEIFSLQWRPMARDATAVAISAVSFHVELQVVIHP